MAFTDRLSFTRKRKKIKQADLVKYVEYEQIDNDKLKRLKEVQGLDAENRSHVFATIDAFIEEAKLKSIAVS